MSNLLKNLLIALGLAVILFVGYVVFIKDGTGGEALISESYTPAAALETQQLLATLNELKSLNVEGRVFSDPLFNSLVDKRTPLGAEPDGRLNPFAPLP